MRRKAKCLLLGSLGMACFLGLAWQQSYVQAGECTGDKQKGNCRCGTERDCALQGTGCNTKLVVGDYTCCEKGDPGDNCHAVEGTVLCGTRFSCTRMGNSCVTDNQIGTSNAPLTSDGGTCTVPS